MASISVCVTSQNWQNLAGRLALMSSSTISHFSKYSIIILLLLYRRREIWSLIVIRRVCPFCKHVFSILCFSLTLTLQMLTQVVSAVIQLVWTRNLCSRKLNLTLQAQQHGYFFLYFIKQNTYGCWPLPARGCPKLLSPRHFRPNAWTLDTANPSDSAWTWPLLVFNNFSLTNKQRNRAQNSKCHTQAG